VLLLSSSVVPETTIEKLASMMRDEDVGAIPVLEDGTLLGIVTDRNVVARCVTESGEPGEMTAEYIIVLCRCAAPQDVHRLHSHHNFSVLIKHFNEASHQAAVRF
jgi:CBS domain-containing protein